MAVKEVFYKKPAEGSFSFIFLDEFLNHFLATASVLVRRNVAVNTPLTNNLVSIEMHAFLYFLSEGNGYYLADKMAVKRRNPGGITMRGAYREQAVDGHYRMWRGVLAFAPRQYKVLIRFKIEEYQRLFLKRCTFTPEKRLLKLLCGAVMNNPFWLLGLSERYKSLILKHILNKHSITI